MVQKICILVLIFIGFQMKAQSNFPEISSDQKVIDTYSHSEIPFSSGIGNKSITKAKFFKHSNKIKEYATIKTVVVNTNSEIEEAKMKLHFYKVNLDGSPGNEITNSIIFSCKKGRNDNAIDVTSEEISIPTNGIFIGLEWLITDENSYSVDQTILEKNVVTQSVVEGKTSEKVLKYAPSIGVIPLRKNNIWELKEGKWVSSNKDKKKYILGSNSNPFYNKYYGMAVSLIVTK